MVRHWFSPYSSASRGSSPSRSSRYSKSGSAAKHLHCASPLNGGDAVPLAVVPAAMRANRSRPSRPAMKVSDLEEASLSALPKRKRACEPLSISSAVASDAHAAGTNALPVAFDERAKLLQICTTNKLSLISKRSNRGCKLCGFDVRVAGAVCPMSCMQHVAC